MAADKGRTPHVIIVGAGLAGISAAIQLKRQLGFENFTIYERATSGVGGTWRDNTYPGCGSDVPGHWYSLSTELNPNWSTYYCGQPELRAYWEELWKKYDLPSHTKLGWDVVSSEWNSTLQRYKVVVRNVETGEEREDQAEATIYAIGGFMSPMFPKELKGIEDFKGISWHSARWRHDVSLKNKRVGVIGNGCSAAQFVPEIAVDPTCQIINFCRTPNWFVPRGNLRYPGWIKWIFAHVPFVMRAYRNLIMARSDMSFLIFRKENKRLVALATKMLSRYIKMKAPKDQIDKLLPNYSPGCKRIIVDPGYLDALHKPNVSLEWTHIDKIVEDGVVLKNGKKVPLDIIIFGTGYSVEAVNLVVKGRGGQSVHDYYREKGGPTAYLGSMIPGFPNMFTLLGPNVASGHASVIFSQEAQINLAVQILKPILSGKAKSFEVRPDVTDKYNDWIQDRLSRSVWVDCNSYYQIGGNKSTKIVGTFPGPVSLFWWLSRKPRWGEYKGVGDEAWVKKRKANKVKNGVLFTLTLVIAAGLAMHFQGDTLVPLLQRIFPAFSTRFV